jgi:hypothetical protein
MFFANYVKGVAPERCADNDGHNTDAIDALTLVIPVAVARSGHTLADAQRSAKEVVALTRRSTVLGGFSDVYVELLTAVLHGTPLRTAVERAATAVGIPSIATVVARCVLARWQVRCPSAPSPPPPAPYLALNLMSGPLCTNVVAPLVRLLP